MKITEKSTIVTIYTDGACKGNPGVGGWGAVLISGEHRKELYGAEAHTTNNRMELMAAIMALNSLTKPCQVELYADSQYVLKGISEWLPGWKRKNWRSSSNAPVKNVDLWQRLDALSAQHQIAWHWVKGHAGHPGNERADALANLAITELATCPS
jgi:ribonuclease HI